MGESAEFEWEELKEGEVTYPFCGIKIVGCPKFTTQVKEALSLIQKKAEIHFDMISSYIGRIREWEDFEGMAAYDSPPTFLLKYESALQSVSWCASVIAHDAMHSKLYHDYRKKNPEKAVPDSVWTGRAIELKCIELQIEVARQIGAPEHELDYLKSLDGSHAER